LDLSTLTHWVTATNFIPLARNSQGFGFTLARQRLMALAGKR
jgi:hypothetical protein